MADYTQSNRKIVALNIIKPSQPVQPTQPIKPSPIIVQPSQPSDHCCYIVRSRVSNRVYIGYTVNFNHRLRQHNGEITGGAKRTRRWRPWIPVCIIQGFYEASSALRFEYRLQHPKRRRKAKESAVTFTLETLINVINSGDGSIEKGNKMPWPPLTIQWFTREYVIQHPCITNICCI